jgi:hypothetical protein
VRLGQGCSKGAVSPARRGSAIGNQRPRGARASGMGGFGVGEGDLVAGQSGPVRALSFGAACRRRDALPHGRCFCAGRSRAGEGERREREGERKGPDSN